MKPTSRIRKPPPAPVRSLSGLLQRTKGPRPKPPNLPLLPVEKKRD